MPSERSQKQAAPRAPDVTRIGYNSDIRQKLGEQARDLDRALSVKSGQTPSDDGALAILVKEVSGMRESVLKLLDEILERVEERQQNALHQHIEYVSHALSLSNVVATDDQGFPLTFREHVCLPPGPGKSSSRLPRFTPRWDTCQTERSKSDASRESSLWTIPQLTRESTGVEVISGSAASVADSIRSRKGKANKMVKATLQAGGSSRNLSAGLSARSAAPLPNDANCMRWHAGQAPSGQRSARGLQPPMMPPPKVLTQQPREPTLAAQDLFAPLEAQPCFEAVQEHPPRTAPTSLADLCLLQGPRPRNEEPLSVSTEMLPEGRKKPSGLLGQASCGARCLTSPRKPSQLLSESAPQSARSEDSHLDGGKPKRSFIRREESPLSGKRKVATEQQLPQGGEEDQQPPQGALREGEEEQKPPHGGEETSDMPFTAPAVIDSVRTEYSGGNRNITCSRHCGRSYPLVEMLRFKAQNIPACCRRPVVTVLDYWSKRLSIGEPEREGALAAVVRSFRFEVFCTLVILSNIIFTTVSQDKQMEYFHGRGEDWSQRNLIVETFYVSVYIVELALRFAVHREYLFFNRDARWNIFDVVLVSLSLVGCVASWATQGQHSQAVNPVLPVEMRILRVAKVSRILRALRALKLLEELRVMLDLCVVSLVNMFWTMTMISIVVFIATVFLMEGVIGHLRSNPADLRRLHMFDGVGATALTLLQATTGGLNWSEPYEATSVLGGLYQPLFLFYVLFFFLALLNIVTSIFLDRVMKLSEPSPELMIEDVSKMGEKDIRILTDMCSQMGCGAPGTLTQEEFQQCVNTRQFGSFLAARGIDIREARAFFALVSEKARGSEVDLEDVMRSCLRMKGAASAVDLQIMRHEINDQYKHLLHLMRKTNSVNA